MKNKKLTYYLEDIMSIKCVILSEFILLCVILGQNVKTISSYHVCSDDNLFHRRIQSINSVCFFLLYSYNYHEKNSYFEIIGWKNSLFIILTYNNYLESSIHYFHPLIYIPLSVSISIITHLINKLSIHK